MAQFYSMSETKKSLPKRKVESSGENSKRLATSANVATAKCFFKPAPQPTQRARGETTDCCGDFTVSFLDEDETKIKRLLDEYGFAIVTDVLTDQECQRVIDGVWDSVEKITKGLDIPVDRNNSLTWSGIRKQENIRNLYKFHGIAHAEFLWTLRQNPNILRIFSSLYNCRPEDLLASFDGLSMQTPPEYGNNRGWYNNNSWYHVDQSYTRPKRECYQGWVTARDVRPGDYTTGFFVGSHKSFEDFGKKFKSTKKDDFNKLLGREQMEFYEARHDQIRVSCPAGSLIVWDSRSLHSGLDPVKERKRPNERIICFLSYGPRFGASKKFLQKRIGLYESRRATSHWAHMNLRTIPEKKPSHAGIRKLESSPIETKCLRLLVGY